MGSFYDFTWTKRSLWAKVKKLSGSVGAGGVVGSSLFAVLFIYRVFVFVKQMNGFLNLCDRSIRA